MFLQFNCNVYYWDGFIEYPNSISLIFHANFFHMCMIYDSIELRNGISIAITAGK